MKKTLKKNSIVICCYNRPNHLKKLIRSIKHLKNRRFYFISDGPKNDYDKVKVKEVRKIISNLKFDHKDLLLEINIGLPNIFIKGISWVFKFEKQVIILEDDTIPSKSFFQYCDILLEKFKFNKRISLVSGCNLKVSLNSKIKHDYFFSKYSNIWGWATWKNRWHHYDKKFLGLENFLNSKYFFNLCQHKPEFSFWKKYFKIHKYNNHNSGDWDYAWTYTNFKKKRLSIVPKKNLIRNIGFDIGTGINPKKSFNLRNSNIIFPLKHPSDIKRNLIYDDFCGMNIYSIPKLLWRIKMKILTIFNF